MKPTSAAQPQPTATPESAAWSLADGRQDPQRAQRRAEDRENDYRRRLLAGMASAITEIGYDATTIADVVQRAGMSKRGFYEMFAGKQDCFLALYRSATELTIAAIETAMGHASSIRGKTHAGVDAFLTVLAGQPALARAHFIDIYGLGEVGLVARRAALDRYVESTWIALWPEEAPRPVPYSAMSAMIGAINELTLRALEDGGEEHLRGTTAEILRVVDLIHPASVHLLR